MDGTELHVSSSASHVPTTGYVTTIMVPVMKVTIPSMCDRVQSGRTNATGSGECSQARQRPQ